MGVLLKNNATSRLASSLTAGATTLSVTSGDGSKFPSPTGGQWFPLTVIKASGVLEIMRCTARSGDVLTVVRAQEGTAAQAFTAGDRVELRLTKAVIDDINTQLSDMQTDLNNTINNLGLVGSVSAFARSTAPAGWLKANGAAVSRTTYADLFAAIGTTFGAGDGSTTFNLPDLRGQFVRGWSDGAVTDGGRVFGSNQSSANLSHTHTATQVAHSHAFSGTTSTNGAHTHTASGIIDLSGGYAFGNANSYKGVVNTSSAGSHNHTFSGTTGSATPSITVAATGDSESRPTNVALLYCIKY